MLAFFLLCSRTFSKRNMSLFESKKITSKTFFNAKLSRYIHSFWIHLTTANGQPQKPPAAKQQIRNVFFSSISLLINAKANNKKKTFEKRTGKLPKPKKQTTPN